MVSTESVRGRRMVPSAVVAIVVAVAFVVGPRLVAGWSVASDFDSPARLAAGAQTAFAEFWSSGRTTPALEQVVHYWRTYHVTKAVLAILLVVVSTRLIVDVTRTVRWQFLAVLPAFVGVLALAAVMANIQGAVEPFASLFPMLLSGEPGSPVAVALGQVRTELVSVGAGVSTPLTLDAIINGFVRFHAVMAVISTVLAVGFSCLAIALWKRRSVSRVDTAFCVVSVVAVVVLVILVIANTGTALMPVPPLVDLIDGGL